MSLQLTFLPDGTIRLAEGHLPLGSACFRVDSDGSQISLIPAEINSAGCRLKGTLKTGQELTLDVHVQGTGENWAGLGFVLTNSGQGILELDQIQLPVLNLDRSVFSIADPLWVMQGAAVKWGQDFASPLPRPYQRENYLGHLQDAEGGGIPVNYIWKSGLGVALMHVQPIPQEMYLPVKSDEESVSTWLERRIPLTLHPGESYSFPQVIFSVHHGDFFDPLDLYRALMEERGVHPADPGPDAFEPAWCSWGYGFDIRSSQMLGVLPALEDLDIHWMTLDDRWFDTYGDWNPREDTFPGGEEEFRQMNAALHAAGRKDQIWWYPLCAEDGHGRWSSHRYIVSDILRQHPEWVVLDREGRVARNNRHLAMLCPALPEVQEYTRKLTEKFIRDWGFDGHKLDNIYTMPACHNPAHHHRYPEESIEAFSKVYQIILDTTLQLKPDSVTQICPCGTPILHSLVPTTNQTVTADPTSSAQIRQRIKFYKGLMGSRAAVFADHVELTESGTDFASEIGAGGVPGTKFVFPVDESLRPAVKKYCFLTPNHGVWWKKWLRIYNQYRPAEGETLNLYDLAFDTPETHAIRGKEGIFYSFYAKKYQGEVEFRGLEEREYQVINLVSGKKLGVVSPEKNKLLVHFRGSLLTLAEPLK